MLLAPHKPKPKTITATGDSAADSILAFSDAASFHVAFGKYVVISCMTTDTLIDYLLSINTHNRKWKENQIEKLSHDMRQGHFEFTSQGVGICTAADESHWMADGQNRCFANKKAGYPSVPFLIVCGLSETAQALMDQQAKRTMADAMSLFLNTTVSTRLIGMLNVIRSCDALRNPDDKNARFHWNGGMSVQLSPYEMADMWEQWEFARTVAATMDAPAPVLATIASFARITSNEKAMDFLLQFKTGENQPAGSPILRLAASFKKIPASGSSANRIRAVRLTAAALKAFQEGRTLKLLREIDSW